MIVNLRILIFLLLVLNPRITWAIFTPTVTDITTSGSTTDGASYTTASITPPANTLILAMVASEIGAGTPNIPTLSGNGLTWVQINTAVTGQNRGTLFRARGTPTTGTVVIDYAGQTISDCTWSIISVTGASVTGADGAGAVVQSATNTASATTSLTVTLAAFSSTENATFGGFAINNNNLITAGSGFAVVAQPGCCSSRAAIEWRTGNDTSVDATWTSSTSQGVAIEVRPLTAAGAPGFVN